MSAAAFTCALHGLLALLHAHMVAAAAAAVAAAEAVVWQAPVPPEADYFRVGFGERCFPACLAALDAFVEDRKAGWAAATAAEAAAEPAELEVAIELK